MRVSRFASLVLGFVAALGLTGPLVAQQHQPFIEPDYFRPDFQFFAPAEYNEYGGEPQPNIGWFLDYDRMYTWVSRPATEQSFTEGDFTWGNRLDVGYMTEEDHGWLVTGIHISGPNAANTLTIERINRFVPLFDEDNDPPTPVQPPADRDDPYTFYRSYTLVQSLNLASYQGFEFCKTWRLEPLHNGSIVEPLVGFRYHVFRDWTRRDNYERFTDEGVPVPNLPNPVVALDDALVERLTINQWNVTNHMVGGELGVRWYKKHVRWVMSGEFRAFAAQNFQSMNHVVAQTTTLYDDIGTDSDVITEVYDKAVNYDHNQEFVFGFDVRAEAAYELTRDVALRFGANFTEFGKGIGRGNNFNFTSEDLQMVAFTFGFTVNR